MSFTMMHFIDITGVFTAHHAGLEIHDHALLTITATFSTIIDLTIMMTTCLNYTSKGEKKD
jgi:hypothetical protein